MISEICHCSIGNSFLLSLFGVGAFNDGSRPEHFPGSIHSKVVAEGVQDEAGGCSYGQRESIPGESIRISVLSLPGEGWDSEQGAIGEKKDSVRPMGGKPKYVA